MTKKWVCVDFETASGCDLKKSGAYVYAEHPTTEILCLDYEEPDGSNACLGPDELAPGGRLLELAEDGETIFVAHGAPFERAIWRSIMVRLFGWPDIPVERWHCTQAVSLSKGLPAKLDVLTRVLNVEHQKDMEGHKFTIGLSKPDKKTGMLDRSIGAINRAKAYCTQDVKGEVDVLKITQHFQGTERAVWEMDQRINDRGIRIDRDYVLACQRIVDRALPPLLSSFAELTGGLKPTQGEKFKGWLAANGVDIPDLKKETVKRLMGEDIEDAEDDQTWLPLSLPPAARSALYIRGLAASASVKKLPAMLACQGADGRARGLVQYHGAGPGRWAGRILQPHNFPRAGVSIGDDETASPDELVAAIMEGDDSYLRMVFGEPMEAVASGLRHALVSDADKAFLIGDFAQIEARIVLALAGQHDAVQTFVDGDPYSNMAEKIYKVPVTKKTAPEKRQIGKNTILGSGFGMGWKTFLYRYCPNETPEFAKSCITAYREDLAPKVVELWYGLERAACKTVWDGTPHEYHGIHFQMEGEWMTCRLPKGRKLWYYQPRRERRAMPWDANDIRPSWSSMAFKAGRWIRRDMYGGLITENVVQGMARDLLVDTMDGCERENLPIVLTVHDENVCEDKADRATIFKQIMLDVKPWAKMYQIPVAIDLMVAERYRK